MADTPSPSELLELATEIVAAHVAHNTVAAADLPKFIHDVYHALAAVGDGKAAPWRGQPAVPAAKSVHPDYIVCLEDGRRLKTLKRHLMTAFGLTPAQYRTKWDLAADYPMVAPNYAKRRSQLAKKIGLGQKPRRRRRG